MKLLTIILFPLFIISCSRSLNITNTLTNKILFEGIENKVKIANLKQQNKYSIFINDSLNFNYNIECDCFPIIINKIKKKEVTINIIKNNKIKDSVVFKTEKIPYPTLLLNGIKQTDIVIKYEKLKKLTSLKASGPNYIGAYKVKSFDLEIIASGRIATMRSNSENFTENQKKAISKLNKGSRLTLQNIKVEFPNKEIIKVAPFVLRVI